jgi:hypothetical protein
MATNRENSLCHLTPNGWIVGDAPPLDRVETWSCCVEEAGRAKRYVEWTRIWTNPDVARSERDRLRKRFWDLAETGTINADSRRKETRARPQPPREFAR